MCPRRGENGSSLKSVRLKRRTVLSPAQEANSDVENAQQLTSELWALTTFLNANPEDMLKELVSELSSYVTFNYFFLKCSKISFKQNN